MKLRLQRVDGPPMGYTTVGYWFWSKPKNRGTLTIQVRKMGDWRHELAVWGHEIIEAFWCKLFRITTEQADAFDSQYEAWYKDGTKNPRQEPGDDPACPYHRGHQLGCAWEEIVIFATLGDWEKYEQACNSAMGI